MGDKPYRIVVAEPYSQDAIARLEGVGEVAVLSDSSPDALVAALDNAHALLIRAKAHVTARVLKAAPHLKVIGRASPSLDHIDLRATARRDIRVVYAPHAAENANVEFAMAMLLALRRRLLFYDHQLRQGKFDALRSPSEFSIAAATIGLLGSDGLAIRLGAILKDGFGCRVLMHDPLRDAETSSDFERVDVDTLLSESDAICVLLRRHRLTRGFLSADRLAQMRPTAVVVNLTRGGVDTTAIAEALTERRLAGAALDAFECDPLPTNHPIRAAPNCILTPSVAGMTIDAIEDRFGVADDVIRVLRGEQPEHEYVDVCSQ